MFDSYKKDSLKTATREKRGKGVCRRVAANSNTPSNWKSFMREYSNKTELYNFLADKTRELCGQDSIICMTRDNGIVCNVQIPALTLLTPCSHEEADTRLFVHCKHAAITGFTTITIKANDIDVVVIAISCFLSLANLGVEDIHKRWLPIRSIAAHLGIKKTKGLLFFHAFSGYDTVSAFRGKGKNRMANMECV